MTVRSLIRYLDRKDLELFRRAAASHPRPLDVTLPYLSRAANKSVLWMCLAGLMWLVGGRFGRRAAARGLLSIAITSPIANLFGKLLTRRPRPVIDDVPVARRLARSPRSSSFPSGHSASAFAFATGASLELAYLGIPLGPLAAAVAYSRVYIGVHYPGDVLAGALLGTSIAWATRSFWPVTPSEPLQERHLQQVDVDPRPEGQGVSIAVNSAAGSTLSGNTTSALRDALPRAEVTEIDISDGHELKEALEAVVDSADAIGVSGGDGSINCAAQVALEHKKPLVVVPAGTLNHLARDIGLEDLEDAVTAVKEGRAIAVDLATIDGKPFVNTASFGAYAELVDAREKLEPKIGKWPAMAFALIGVLRRGDPVEVEIDGTPRRIWMIFVGNCRYHPSGFAPTWRERLDDGELDIRIVDASAPFARSRLVASVLTGRLGRSHVYEQRRAKKVAVRSLEGPLRLSRDGETFDGSEEFEIEKLPEPLHVYAGPG